MLNSVTVLGSGIEISADAFCACQSLASLFVAGDAPILAPAAFAYDTNAIAYYLDSATGWSEFTESSGIPAVLWNAVIQTSDGNFGVRNGQFGFDIMGTINIPIVVESCSNLANPVWVPLQSLTLTNGLFYFSEPFQPDTAGRFYRISSP
jgi:hypothetical protein